jgi:glycine/D-amino acid oxidase-like deaminating enzyme
VSRNLERFPPPPPGMRAHLTIVGGGLAGLVAAVAAREAGLDVTLHEERSQLGGRGRTAPGAYRANWGPHVIYTDGPLWSWLDRRGLARPAYRDPALARVAFRASGRARLLPPPAVSTGIIRLRDAQAPADRSFSEWATEWLNDERAAAQIAAFMGVVTFDYDPGRLSAAFVTERLRRATSFPAQGPLPPGRLGDPHHAARQPRASAGCAPRDRQPHHMPATRPGDPRHSPATRRQAAR